MNTEKTGLLKQQFNACKHGFIAVGVLSCVINLLLLTVPLYMLQLYDRVLTSHSRDTLLMLTLIALFSLVILGLLDLARSRTFAHVGFWLSKKISPLALERSADDVLRGGTYATHSQRDINTLCQFISSSSIFSLFDAPWTPIYLLVIYLLHPVLGQIALLGAVVLLCIAATNEVMTRQLLREANHGARSAQNTIDTSLRNAEVIQAMGMMPAILSNWQAKNDPVLDLQHKASKRSGAWYSFSKFLRLCLQLVMLGSGAYLVLGNQLTPGIMIAASILLARALAPVEQSIGVWKQLLAARQSYQQLNKYFENSITRTAGIQLPTPTGKLDIEKLYFKPASSDKAILSGISLDIEAGEMIAILGPTGAGKSTLARLIMGVNKPNAGVVRLDDAEVFSWDREDFGKHVGYLPQDVELFSGTVKENIARMQEVDDEAVIKAAKLAGVHEMILHLPEGYNTVIGNQQVVLSGGQRQHIALARALYQDPCLVILDEANSNLDHDGETALLKAIQTLKENNATVIVIAHRPAMVQHVDRIVVLKEGKIHLEGTRDEVLARLEELAKTYAVKKRHINKDDNKKAG